MSTNCLVPWHFRRHCTIAVKPREIWGF